MMSKATSVVFNIVRATNSSKASFPFFGKPSSSSRFGARSAYFLRLGLADLAESDE